MGLRLVLLPHGDDALAVRIVGASFGELPKGERVAFKGRPRASRYPQEAVRRRVTGNVYLALKIGRDGRPVDMLVEQVNLTVVDGERQMAHWRGLFEDAALRNARHWRFTVPSAGPDVDAPYWTARVPLAFVLSHRPTAGRWEAYIPGPVREIPWDIAQDNTVGIGALAFGEIHTAGSTLKLLTPLDDA